MAKTMLFQICHYNTSAILSFDVTIKRVFAAWGREKYKWSVTKRGVTVSGVHLQGFD